MSIIPTLCSFFFALHLESSLNLSADKKSTCNLYICELVFHFIQSGIQIFFSYCLSKYPLPPFLSVTIFLKSKVKHTGVDITCFFQDAKSSLANHKKCFLEACYGTSQTSKLQPFTKKSYSRKQFPQKNPPQMFESVLKNTNSYFDESYPKYQPLH